jgi:transcriptional regulator with XRE-family HTH domain
MTLRNYLRSHRKQRQFSQGEVAFLLGLNSQSGVSQHEVLARLPEFKVLLKYELLFDHPVSELYPELRAKARAELLSRVRALLRRLERQSGRATARKVELLTDVQGRLKKKP